MVGRLGHGVAGALFLLSALVQLNDPDPVLWVAVYLAAAALAAGGVVGRPRVAWPAAVLVVWALGWAGSMVAEGLAAAPWGDVFGQATMKTEAVERWRETLGLGLVLAYAAGRFFSAPRGSGPPGPRSP